MANDADMAECDGEKVVTMMDVLQEQQEFEEDANAVLGGSDDNNCTYSKGYIKRQAIYACITCCSEAKIDPSKRAGMCLACSLNCHENHELIELYTKRNFRCDCGNSKFNSHPCQFTPNKVGLNIDNKYNQNFSGLYCICHRPYPDPESPSEDEMIQCIICEDWLHSSHLDAIVPANDQYSEMICKTCMEKNEFLHDYSGFAVCPENADVDVTAVNGNGENIHENSKNGYNNEIKSEIAEDTTTVLNEIAHTEVSLEDSNKLQQTADTTNGINVHMETSNEVNTELQETVGTSNESDVSSNVEMTKEKTDKTDNDASTENKTTNIENNKDIECENSSAEEKQPESANASGDALMETVQLDEPKRSLLNTKNIEEKVNNIIQEEKQVQPTNDTTDLEMEIDHSKDNVKDILSRESEKHTAVQNESNDVDMDQSENGILPKDKSNEISSTTEKEKQTETLKEAESDEIDKTEVISDTKVEDSIQENNSEIKVNQVNTENKTEMEEKETQFEENVAESSNKIEGTRKQDNSHIDQLNTEPEKSINNNDSVPNEKPNEDIKEYGETSGNIKEKIAGDNDYGITEKEENELLGDDNSEDVTKKKVDDSVESNYDKDKINTIPENESTTKGSETVIESSDVDTYKPGFHENEPISEKDSTNSATKTESNNIDKSINVESATNNKSDITSDQIVEQIEEETVDNNGPSGTEKEMNNEKSAKSESTDDKEDKSHEITKEIESDASVNKDVEVEDSTQIVPTIDKKCEITENSDIADKDNVNEMVNKSCDNTDLEVNNTSTDCSDPENKVSGDTDISTEGIKENKRKHPDEEVDVSTKKLKIDDHKCIRPQGVKRVFKGATFWPHNFRHKLCTCNECLSMYKDLAVLFIIDPEDTATAYERLGKEKTDGAPSSQYEKGLQALSSLDRIQQINALTEYNRMRDKLLDFLQSFKDRREIVKEEDIKAFFAGMKPKREPDGVYFCR